MQASMRQHFSQIFFSALLLVIVPGSALSAQAPSSPVATQTTSQTTNQATPSQIMQPALQTLAQSLDTIRLDKWKGSNASRDETDTNISSIRRDLEQTLPPMLADADRAPDSITRVLPVFRNIGALYDVLLRVALVGRSSAPAPQSAALDQALTSLESSRRSLGDRLESTALVQEKQIGDLQVKLRAALAPPPPAPAPEPAPPPPVKKHKARPKASPKPATPAANSQGSSTAPH